MLEEPDKDGVTLPVINRGCSLHRHWQGERKSRVVIRINFRGHILREPPEAVNSTCSELCPTCWWHRRGSSPYPASARGGRSLPEHTGGRVIVRDPSLASLRLLQLPRRPSTILFIYFKVESKSREASKPRGAPGGAASSYGRQLSAPSQGGELRAWQGKAAPFVIRSHETPTSCLF